MRCQHCGKRLPILRKLTDGEFCSPAHRRSFQEEQERQALSRLLEASQMGASRRAQETKPDNNAGTPVKQVVATPPSKGSKSSPSIPQPCDHFFPLAPQRPRGHLTSDGPRTLPIQPELLLTDELARRTPPRLQRRLRGAGLSRHYGPEPLAARPAPAATVVARHTNSLANPALGPLAARSTPPQSARLRSGGRWPVRIAVRRTPPEVRPASLSRLPAQSLGTFFPALHATTDWVAPRLLNATRHAEAARITIAPLRASLPLRQTVKPLPVTQRTPEPRPARTLELRLGAPATAGLLPNIFALRPTAALEPVLWDAPSAAFGLQRIELSWLGRPFAVKCRVRAPQRLLRLTLKAGTLQGTVSATLQRLSPLQWSGTPLAVPQRGPSRRPINAIRGTWLQALGMPSAAEPTGAVEPVAVTPAHFGQRKPLPPPGKLTAPTPGALDRLVALPARYRPEARVMADRGRTLFLTVMAKPLSLGTPLALPKRKKAEARAVKVATGCVPPFAAAQLRAAHIPAVAQRPVAWLPYAADEIEISPRSSKPSSAMPKPSRRMVRWIPTLPLCVEGAGLATFPQTWQTLHLKTLSPRLAFHPDPARTKRRSLVPDALRQSFARTPAARTWKLAPADLRWVAMVLPVVVGVAWWSLAPKSRPSEETVAEEVQQVAAAAAPAAPLNTKGRAVPPRTLVAKAALPETPSSIATEAAKPAGFLDSYLAPLEAKIRSRAAIEVSDDFRSGLSAWEGDRGWSDGWSYDQAGFVLPGSLALLRPTTGLTDYSFEFLGMIENKALSWVFRAKDTRNYYAGKIVVVQGGPLPVVAFVRYRVVNGREEGRKVIPLHESVRAQTLYRVKIDVNGNDFTTSVLGKIVDTFTDAVHPQGGVGLFSARGEQAKIRWVEVSHQYDSIGRLCAFLAPPRLERQPEERSVAGKKLAPKKRGS